MEQVRIVPYASSSESAKKLSDFLKAVAKADIKRVSRRSYLGDPREFIVNWGCSSIAVNQCAALLNQPHAVAAAANKLSTLFELTRHKVPTLEWTIDRQEAAEWCGKGALVYARYALTGHAGDGIKIFGTPEEVLTDSPAKLYTKRFNALKEFRVHVFRGEVIDFVRKIERPERENANLIRNNENCAFRRGGVVLPVKVQQAAIAAVKSLGLDFGAVDVLYKPTRDIPAVLEVNTAPGLGKTAATNYTKAIIQTFGLEAYQ